MESAGIPKVRQGIELRTLMPHLAEGTLTQKYLAEHLTIEQYQMILKDMQRRLQIHVETDVLDVGGGPYQGTPDVTIDDSSDAGDDAIETMPEQEQVWPALYRRAMAAGMSEETWYAKRDDFSYTCADMATAIARLEGGSDDTRVRQP